MAKIKEIKKGEIAIYKAPKGEARVEVRLEKETVWLDTHQIASVFDVDRTVIVKHIGNIYQSRELLENSTCAKIAQVAADGKIRQMNIYNLDVIISVGYRVNSRKATDFRIWATRVLKNHLIEGYTINEKRLLQAESRFKELQEVVSFLREKSKHELLSGQGKEILDLLANYSKTLTLLEQYDKEKLSLVRRGRGKYRLTYEAAKLIISELKKELMAKKEAGTLFGQDYGEKLKGILGNLYQTFGGKELYLSLEEKAAHLLYFVVKDHPFVDGNKRIASFLFVYFLDKNSYLYKASGEKKINDNALVALALLIAESNPNEKDVLIKIITNLIGN
jgi:prophage maintenance system killer protein